MSSLRRIAQNFGMVVSGQAVIMSMGFAALALNTRALGLDDLGKLFLLQAFCELVSKVVSFQNWKSFSKVGADIEKRGSLKALWLYGTALDFGAASLSALLVASVLLTAPGLVGLDAETARLGLVFAVSLVFSGKGTSVGALRLLGAFGRSVAIDVLQACALLINAALLFALSAALPAYLLTIPAITACASVLTLAAAWQKINAADTGMRDARFDKAARRRFLHFALGASATGSLNALRQRGEILIVGALLGSSAAALFGVAYRLAALIARFANAAQVAIFPEFSRMASAGQIEQAAGLAFKAMFWSAPAALAAVLGIMVFGADILTLLFGEGYGAAAPALVLLTIGAAIFSSGFALGPLVQISFGSWAFFRIALVAFGGFAIFAVLGPALFGLNGAGAGAVAYSTMLCAICAMVIVSNLKQRRRRGNA